MKISPISIARISQLKYPKTQQSFKGIVLSDYYEPSRKDIYKTIKVKHTDGTSEQATILKKDAIYYGTQDAKKFTIQNSKRTIGQLTVCKHPRHSGLFMSNLYTEEPECRTYKGLGTELIKCAIEESKRQGKRGELSCYAHFDYRAPYVFYVKNNFLIADYNDAFIKSPRLYNAALLYITKNNLDPFEILPKKYDKFYMTLDKKDAKATLQNKRLYETRICDEVAKTIIDNEHYSAQLIQSANDGEYFLQVLNDDLEQGRLCLIIALQACKKDGEKYFKITDVVNDLPNSYHKIDNFGYSLLDDLAKKYL